MISLNSRIPVIVDTEGPAGISLSLSESGAILLYPLAKTGMFLPTGEDGHWSAVEWLMRRMGDVGPNFGQVFHFLHQHLEDAPTADIAYGRSRYGAEIAHKQRRPGFSLSVLGEISLVAKAD